METQTKSLLVRDVTVTLVGLTALVGIYAFLRLASVLANIPFP